MYHIFFKSVSRLAILCSCLGSFALSLQAADPLKIVFLGDQGHHRPADLAGYLIPVLKQKGGFAAPYLLYPPYKPAMKKIVDILLRWF